MRMIGCYGHVASMGRRGMHVKYWWESQKERDHYDDIRIGGRIMLKWILQK
jgi:hypothetical protein